MQFQPVENYFNSLSFRSPNKNLHSEDWYDHFVASSFFPLFFVSSTNYFSRAITNFDKFRALFVRHSPSRKNNALPKLIFAKLIAPARGYFSIIPKEISASHSAGQSRKIFPWILVKILWWPDTSIRKFDSISFYSIEFHMKKRKRKKL